MPRSHGLLRVGMLSVAFAGALYGTGMFILAVHEAGHALAAHAVGFGVEAVVIPWMPTGGAHVTPGTPLYEEIGRYDGVWVYGGGALATLLAAILALATSRRRTLSGSLVASAGFGATGMGLLLHGAGARSVTDLRMIEAMLGLDRAVLGPGYLMAGVALSLAGGWLLYGTLAHRVGAVVPGWSAGARALAVVLLGWAPTAALLALIFGEGRMILAAQVSSLLVALLATMRAGTQASPGRGLLRADVLQGILMLGIGATAVLGARSLASPAPPLDGSDVTSLRRAAQHAGSPREALDLLSRAGTIAPEDARVRHDLGRWHVRARDYGEAIAALEACLRLDPGDTSCQGLLAHCYGMEGRSDEAVALLRDLAARDPALRESAILQAGGWRRRAARSAPAPIPGDTIPGR